MISVNPWNGEVIFEHKQDSEITLNRKIKKSQDAFLLWRNKTYNYRTLKMYKLAEELEIQKSRLSLLMTREMGKPIQQSEAEIEKCAWVCRYYADNTGNFLADQLIETEAKKSFIRYNPLGVILGVMPWNFPFWQFFRFAVPTIMAGNTVLLKHASSVMQCAKSIEQLFKDADFEDDIVQSLIIPSSTVKSVINNPIIKAVSLTGSENAGSQVAAHAGSKIKKTILELGGNNAFIVFNDIDIELVLEKAIWARFQNTGQSCIAGKRFFIHSSIYTQFLERYIDKLSGIKFGDPQEKDTKIGPMSSVRLAEELELQINKSLDKGARIVYGGNREGAKFHPTVIENIKPGMPAFDEELFGPVASFTKFKDEEEVIKLSNNSRFGLGVSIFTTNESRMNRMIDQMEEGAVFFNELVKSDPRLPFGGVKNSGYGRELSKVGIMEFVNQKTVYIL